MAIAFADDLSLILATEDFAVSAIYGGSTITGIFDNETVPMDAGGIAQVHQAQPRFTGRTVDFGTLNAGNTIEVDGTVYTIVAWIHDGTGVTVLQLEVPV